MEARLASRLNDIHQQLVDVNRRACVKQAPADGLSDLMLALYTEGKIVYPQQQVISTLRFASMNARQDDINEAHKSTYEWMLTRSGPHSIRFTEWLRHSDGAYWITGKAGSGKSTLLKYISRHAITQALLQEWAGTRELVVVRHYFWSLGSEMQKSKQGFLRSILFEILRKCPSIMEQVCPARLKLERSHIWAQSELDESIENLAQQTLRHNGRDLCFCFFVDGLDEYDDRGSHNMEGTMQDFEDLIRIVQKLGSSSSIKVCASSRPWNVFSETFEEATRVGNMLILHEHTRPDIRRVVQDSLRPRLSNLPTQRSLYQKLVNDIVDKAEGVFLWVVLVIRELIKSLRNADDIAHLQKRLESIPPELDAFFDRIFNSIDPFYQPQTARIFHTTAAAVEPLPAIILDIIESDNPERLATTMVLRPSGDGSLEQEMVDRIVKQVNGRCLDLLEVRKPRGLTGNPTNATGSFSTFFYTIEFMHRTVREYLRTAKLTAKLTKMAGSGFCVETTLCALYLSALKHEPLDSRVEQLLPTQSNGSEVRIHDFCWRAFCEMLHSARLIEERQGIAPLRLLEDLDLTRTRLTRDTPKYWAKSRENKFLDLDVTDFAYKFYYGDESFPSLLVASGLTLSVQRYWDQRSQEPPIRDCTLLDVALHSNALNGIDYHVVSFLLDHGANPNQSIPGSSTTVFDEFLSTIATMKRVPDGHVPEVRVLELLLSHGAYAQAHFCKSPLATQDDSPCTPPELFSEVYGAAVAAQLSATMSSNASAAREAQDTGRAAKVRSWTWRSLFRLD